MIIATYKHLVIALRAYTCADCGDEHVQKKVGAPPSFCPACRTKRALAGQAAKRAVPDPLAGEGSARAGNLDVSLPTSGRRGVTPASAHPFRSRA